MYVQVEKTKETKRKAVANYVEQKKSNGFQGYRFEDNRPEVIAQRKLRDMATNSPSVQQLKTIQEMADNGPQALRKKTARDGEQ